MIKDLASFSKSLKKARNDRGYSQVELAQKSQIQQSSISQFEQGKKRPSRKTLEILANSLQLGQTDTSMLLLEAGYSDLQSSNKSLQVIEKLSLILNNQTLNRSAGPIIEDLIENFFDGWHYYLHAKENQYQRSWLSTSKYCDEAKHNIDICLKISQIIILDTKGVAEYHLGNLSTAEAQFDSANALIEDLISGINDQNNSPYEYKFLQGLVSSHLGDLYRSRSEFERAKKIYFEANKRFLEIKNNANYAINFSLARTNRKIGLCYLSIGDPINAEIYLQNSKNIIAESISDNDKNNRAIYEEIKTLMYFGWLQNLYHKPDEALIYRQHALQKALLYKLPNGQEDQYLLMQGYLYYGYELFGNGRIDEAEINLITAVDFANKINNTKELGLIYLELGRLYTLKGEKKFSKENEELGNKNHDWEKAEDYFALSKKIFEEHHNKLRIGACLNRLSELEIKQCKFEKALTNLSDASNIFKEIANFHYYADVYQKICEIYFIRSEWPNAITKSTHVLQFLKENNCFDNQVISLFFSIKGCAMAALGCEKKDNNLIIESKEQFVKAFKYVFFITGENRRIILANFENAIGSILIYQGNIIAKEYLSCLNLDIAKPEISQQGFLTNENLNFFREWLTNIDQKLS
jgi:transcriptional regulator with XRE-family HTH domain